VSVTRVAHLCETWHIEYPISVARSFVSCVFKTTSCYRISAFYSAHFQMTPDQFLPPSYPIDGAALESLSHGEKMRMALYKYHEDYSCPGNDLKVLSFTSKANVAIQETLMSFSSNV
jgi:hypothetical protein